MDLSPAAVKIGWDPSGSQLCVKLTPKPDCTAASPATIHTTAILNPTGGGAAVTGEATGDVSITRAADDCAIALVKMVNGEVATRIPGRLGTARRPGDLHLRDHHPGAFSLGEPVLHDDATTPDRPDDDFTPTYTGGDSNDNHQLDPGETWTYRAEAIASAAGTFTNTATATAPGATNNPVHATGVYTTAEPGSPWSRRPTALPPPNPVWVRLGATR